VIIGEDFNIRIGELGRGNEGEEDRRSKDKTVGNSGKNFFGWIQDKGWCLLNGKTKGDWRGEFTYVGARGSTVIDYILVNERALDKTIDFKVESRFGPHAPASETKEERRGPQGRGRKGRGRSGKE